MCNKQYRNYGFGWDQNSEGKFDYVDYNDEQTRLWHALFGDGEVSYVQRGPFCSVHCAHEAWKAGVDGVPIFYKPQKIQ